MADHMAERLGLSADQSAQVKAIQADTRQQEMQLRQQETAKIRALLNEEQRAKFDQMQQRMQGRMQGRRGGAGMGPQDASPPSPQQ
jgi:hypothetical protein